MERPPVSGTSPDRQLLSAYVHITFYIHTLLLFTIPPLRLFCQKLWELCRIGIVRSRQRFWENGFWSLGRGWFSAAGIAWSFLCLMGRGHAGSGGDWCWSGERGGLAGLMLVAGSGGEAGQAGSRVAARQKEQKVGKSCKIFAFRYLIKTPGV